MSSERNGACVEHLVSRLGAVLAIGRPPPRRIVRRITENHVGGSFLDIQVLCNCRGGHASPDPLRPLPICDSLANGEP